MSQNQFAVIVNVIQIVFMLVFMHTDLGSGAKSAQSLLCLCLGNTVLLTIIISLWLRLFLSMHVCIILTNFHN